MKLGEGTGIQKKSTEVLLSWSSFLPPNIYYLIFGSHHDSFHSGSAAQRKLSSTPIQHMTSVNRAFFVLFKWQILASPLSPGIIIKMFLVVRLAQLFGRFSLPVIVQKLDDSRLLGSGSGTCLSAVKGMNSKIYEYDNLRAYLSIWAKRVSGFIDVRLLS